MRFAGSASNAMFGALASSPQFSALGEVGMKSRNLQQSAAMAADANAAISDINAAAMVEAAEANAEAIKAAGEAQGQASLASGIGSGISTLAGGFAGMGGGGAGGIGGPSTALPKLGAHVPAGPVPYGSLPHSFGGM